MTDMLIKLYDLPVIRPAQVAMSQVESSLVIRKPIGPEHAVILAWIEARFGPGWASEAGVALGNRPVTLWLAQQHGALVGFACYDATARGCVGPIGVDDSARARGCGAALLRACLDDMRAAGYVYAVAGAVGPRAFFEKVAAAVEIAGSSPGFYRDYIKAPV